MHKKLFLAQAYRVLNDIQAEFFNLDFPVYLKVSTDKKFNKNFAAMWELKNHTNDAGIEICVHEIKIAYNCHCGNIPYLMETIAHELVHCQQYETIKTFEHDRAFLSRLDYILINLGLFPTSKEYRAILKKY